ncbi:alpha/beta-type small acid-soluble spore protein [Paenibacillus guangzhouensis]|uniref:alpha/beta-type small acid-soluble spore protein n=1 Tax=Paenibacillus guangzhouensis TaxID=1473112 RepID=UPI001267571D|nr:alpha/beta-type small acid-soluble spore protein [Paenibacillus guangzhouensis]
MARNRKLVPEAQLALAQMKMEIAQELGISLPADGYYGKMSTKDIGTIGGGMTKRLVQMGLQLSHR